MTTCLGKSCSFTYAVFGKELFIQFSVFVNVYLFVRVLLSLLVLRVGCSI